MAERRYTINAFTIDLQCPGADSASDDTDSPGRRPLLELLMQADVKATFFIDANLAVATPDLVKSINAHEHETALLIPFAEAHPSDFHAQVVIAKATLESVLSRRVIGCRILPVSSMGTPSPENYRSLVHAGFVYSSSTYPPTDLRIGLQNTRRRAWPARVPEGTIWELPLTGWRPLGVGAFPVRSAHPDRHSAWMVARSIDGMNRHGEPALLSISCCLESGEPTIGPDTGKRLSRIFSGYRFSTMGDAFASRLTLGFDDAASGPRRRTGITRCDAQTAATIL